MYSQRGEEQIILDYFGSHTGRFLDVGAYDGVTFSNTRQLYLDGWSGVMVEPGEAAFKELIAKYAYQGNAVLINKAVSEHERTIRFYEGVGGVDHPGALSSVHAGHIKKWKTAGLKVKITEVEEIKYDTIFDEWGSDFDFISIDAEGVSLRLLHLIPFGRLDRIKCICVEHDNKFTEIIQHGLIHGFDRYAVTAENVIMMKGTHV
jgi:FkbM family methyltransferase